MNAIMHLPLKLGILVLVVGLAACGNRDAQNNEPKAPQPARPSLQTSAPRKVAPVAKRAPTPVPAAVQAKFHDTMERAMADVPKSIRPQFHKELFCLVKARNIEAQKTGKPAPMLSIDDVRTISDKIKLNPKRGSSCAS